MNHCIVCQTPLSPGLTAWHRVCMPCGYEGANLQPSINEASAHQSLDEALRASGLRALRRLNFQQILGHLPGATGSRLLDVGSAHGWFLEEARTRFAAQGIEPDEAVAQAAQAKGLTVRIGLFPDALEAGEQFDVIVFNDVFEHIPDGAGVLAAVQRHLAPGGLLVLNLPSSRGVFYRLAKLLGRAGFFGPFDRMWQKGLPSPHVHFFDPDNLQRLCAAAGLVEQERFHLDTFAVRGLWARLRCVKDTPLPLTVASYLAILLVLPLLSLLPKDAQVSVFRRS